MRIFGGELRACQEAYIAKERKKNQIFLSALALFLRQIRIEMGKQERPAGGTPALLDRIAPRTQPSSLTRSTCLARARER